MNARKQYLEEIGNRADEKGRCRLLDEAEKRTGLNRKYLIRVLNHPHRQRPRKWQRRRAEYGAAVVTALVKVWDIFEQPCGQRMVAVLRRELDRLRKLGELRCGDPVADQLKQISASTIEAFRVGLPPDQLCSPHDLTSNRVQLSYGRQAKHQRQCLGQYSKGNRCRSRKSGLAGRRSARRNTGTCEVREKREIAQKRQAPSAKAPEESPEEGRCAKLSER